MKRVLLIGLCGVLLFAVVAYITTVPNLQAETSCRLWHFQGMYCKPCNYLYNDTAGGSTPDEMPKTCKKCGEQLYEYYFYVQLCK